MQRCEHGGSFKSAKDRIVDQAVPQKLGPPVHDAMPDGGGRRHLALGEQLSYANDRVALRGNG
jgi:hypothetical protein